MKKYATIRSRTHLSYGTKDIYKIYNKKPVGKGALTAFQKRFYKVQEIRNYYDISSRYVLPNILNTIIKLERRLDIVVVRMNLAMSINESRQKINHGKVYVNDKEVVSINFIVKEGDKIEVRGERKKVNKVSKFIMNIPMNMEVNYELSILEMLY
jgi:ribosomal protein S4